MPRSFRVLRGAGALLEQLEDVAVLLARRARHPDLAGAVARRVRVEAACGDSAPPRRAVADAVSSGCSMPRSPAKPQHPQASGTTASAATASASAAGAPSSRAASTSRSDAAPASRAGRAPRGGQQRRSAAKSTESTMRSRTGRPSSSAPARAHARGPRCRRSRRTTIGRRPPSDADAERRARCARHRGVPAAGPSTSTACRSTAPSMPSGVDELDARRARRGAGSAVADADAASRGAEHRRHAGREEDGVGGRGPASCRRGALRRRQVRRLRRHDVGAEHRARRRALAAARAGGTASRGQRASRRPG